MRQFDVVENLNSRTRSRYPFAVVLQHDRIDGLSTVIVAPLVVAATVPDLDRLHPVVAVGDQSYRVVVEELAAISRGSLGRVVSSVEGDRFALIRALDVLFTGF